MSLVKKPPIHLRADQRIILYFRDSWFVWAKYGLIGGALLGAAVLGLLAGKMNPLYAVIAACIPLLIVGVEFLLNAKEQWPLLILITTAFIPFSLPTGTESRLVISLVVTLGLTAIWIIQMMINKRIWIYPARVNVPLLGFCLTVVISLIWSNVFRDPLVYTGRSFPIVQTASAIVMLMLPSAFLMTANLIESIRNLKQLTIVMLIAAGLGLVGRFLNLPIPVNSDGLSAMWFIGISVSLVYFNKDLSWHLKLALLAIAGGWVIWGFGLHISWLAGWVPGFIVLGVLTWQRSKKLAILIAILGIIFIALNSSYYLGTVLGNEQNESGSTRLAAWEMNWLVTGKHLLFGTGPAGYAAYYMSYFPTQAMATHNNYLDILSQTGAVGLFLSVWFFIALIWQGYKLTRRLKGRGDFIEALANAAFAGTIGSLFMMAFGDWLFPFAYTQTIAGFRHAVYNWIFMGTIIVLDRLTQSNDEAETYA